MTEKYNCGEGDFTIVWKIENFSHCPVTYGNSLMSVGQTIPNFTGTWRLYFYPRGYRDAYVECHLNKYSGDTAAKINCQFCVCTTKGEVLYGIENENLNFPGFTDTYNSIGRFERNIIEKLPEDILVIHCHVLNPDSDGNGNPVHYFIRTSMQLQRRVFLWKLDKFSSLQLREEKNYILPAITSNRPTTLTFGLSLSGDNLEDSSVQISLNFKEVKRPFFSTCALHVVNKNGTAWKYMREEYSLNSGDHFRIFPQFLLRHEVVSADLPDDTLTIRGEVTMTGIHGSTEQIVSGLQTREAVAAAEGAIPTLASLPSTLSTDMLSLLAGSGPPSDFELRVQGRSFPVHRLVLGSRSAVFRAMFTNDMLEREQGSLELTDTDADTVERLLRYAYADAHPPSELAFRPLADLYAAADKYALMGFRGICTRRLVQGLSPTNAPETLRLADRHGDRNFKEEVMEYVFSRGRVVLESEQWKGLEQDHPRLAAETLRRIFCEKVL